MCPFRYVLSSKLLQIALTLALPRGRIPISHSEVGATLVARTAYNLSFLKQVTALAMVVEHFYVRILYKASPAFTILKGDAKRLHVRVLQTVFILQGFSEVPL